jgi:hypothetical protein
MVLEHLLPSIQPQSFLEWTGTSLGQFIAEFYAILLEEHLQVTLEKLEVGISSSLVSKTDRNGSLMFKHGDCAGQGRCSSNHDGILPAVLKVALSSWKNASLFGNNVWIMGCT